MDGDAHVVHLSEQSGQPSSGRGRAGLCGDAHGVHQEPVAAQIEKLLSHLMFRARGRKPASFGLAGVSVFWKVVILLSPYFC